MRAFVTGAAGFIGRRLTEKLASLGVAVVAVDDFSRPGTSFNAEQLREKGINVERLDVTDGDALARLLEETQEIQVVFHLAAQVAVTTSYRDPNLDFRVNALGTFNLVNSIRRFHPHAHCVYSSTNKVFGSRKFQKPVGNMVAPRPYSPYGVSKYVGDLYFQEYRRQEFGLSSTVLRQSCVFGPGQIGLEDQGWVAWFALANLNQLPITVFGSGNQVRDLLHIDDLVELYLKAAEKRLNGDFVVGGGPDRVQSVKDVIEAIPAITGKSFISIFNKESRPGDQEYFVADNTDLRDLVGWEPKKTFEDGLHELISWLGSNRRAISSVWK